MAVADATARKVGSQAIRSPSADEVGIDAVMREFFQKKPNQGGVEEVTAKETVEAGAPRRDFDMATELLDRASQAFDLLINRCQALEHDFDDANEVARARAAEQEETIEQWKRLASGLKAQVDASEQAAAVLKARCETAEARAVAAEQRIVELERASRQAAAYAATADQLSTKLHDKVVSAFGIGSRAHPVLEAVATRAAAE